MTSHHPYEFAVKFWGVRGNIPTPGAETMRYGGNTACVEFQVAGQRLIFDGGTGLRVLGKQLLQEMPVQAHIFFTHTYWDRIQGFPFFAPAFQTGNRFDVYGAVGQNGASIKQRLSDQMLRPNFPVPLQMMQASLCFHDIGPGSIIRLEKNIVVEAIALHRSNSALGYRVTWNEHSVVYATDVEYRDDQLDPGLLYLAHQADLLIYDIASDISSDVASTEPNFSATSPPAWHTSIEVANKTQAKRLVLFHHDPGDEDDFLDQVAAKLQASSPCVKLAREGMVVGVAPCI
jgi:phosphoribosyl 1,2-cyclic phosphodiesterase